MFSSQVRIVTGLTLIYIGLVQSYTYNGYTYGTNSKQSTRKITIKQGVLQGVVVEPKVNHALPPIEMYLGIPYAAPPVGDLRFMPPGSAPSWFGVKFADSLMPVCPQKLPNMNNMEASRKEYFSKLVQHLLNQSEDCLYLNIYAPLQDGNRPHSKKYPVMVFIHGESFEWNSGNPYDGSVLAAHGDVIVVTLNYRLGILGFLKVGLEETSSSNFGLVDQVAALLWVQENIAAFGGDPSLVTLFGHGTGAACISLLMLSPMVARGEEALFKRAILMSGTALADWALAGTSRQVTYQVAEALNCPTDAVELATCLRKKRLSEIMEVAASTRDYMTRFGPIVDGRVVPNDPHQIMSTYNDFFKRYELMYGLTEVESVHLLEPVGLTYGLLEKERDQELRKYLYTRCEYKPELYVAHTLAMYTEDGRYGDGGQGVQVPEFTGHEPDRASVARDVLLDMLSDARSAAPVALTARYNAGVNPQSYFYVFGHTTASREFIRNKTTHGEELPYVFGVPLDGPKYHFTDHYNNQERLFSEFVMSLWCNFAHTGNPNGGRNTFLTLHPTDWKQYDIDWPEFDKKNERYLYLAIPPQVRQHYRSKEIHYWNDILPVLLKNRSSVQYFITKPPQHRQTDFPFITKSPPKNLPSWFPFGKGTSVDKHRNVPERKPNDVAYGTIKLKPDDGAPSTTRRNEYGTVVTKEPQVKGGGTAMIVLIAVGAVFLLINVVLFAGLYYKCTRFKSRESRSYVDPVESQDEQVKDEEYTEHGCSIMKMISRSSKSEDTYEAVKVSDDGSGKYKLSRQMSASTIDPHTKVRDWIAHEIVQRCSPKFVRRPKVEIPIEQIKVKTSSLDSARSKTTQSYSTLGKSPTRPVSPAEGCGSLIPKMKAQKVSVAVDATPAARSPSVLRQQPIELTKSLDYSTNYPKEPGPMRRSNTVDNILDASDFKQNVDLDEPPTVVKIEHHHAKSRSDPVDGLVYARPGKKMTTFSGDVNVTSREEDDHVPPLSAEESLMTIKRRNFPKVLPDYPDKQYLSYKRRSMPVQSPLFMPIPENSSFQPGPKGQVKTPPAPPPRSTSSLGRKCAVKMAEEPPPETEPEITCNNLVIGPLLPRKVDPIYDNLQDQVAKIEKQPKTVVTADPNNPIKKNDAKVIIKPTINRGTIDRRNNTIPRVTAKDNAVDRPPNDENSEVLASNEDLKRSQIPVLVKSTKESSSESSPSDESETGTVIKRV